MKTLTVKVVLEVDDDMIATNIAYDVEDILMAAANRAGIAHTKRVLDVQPIVAVYEKESNG